MKGLCEVFWGSLSGVLACEPLQVGEIKVVLPLSYSDGDFIVVFIQERFDGIEVSDRGGTLHWAYAQLGIFRLKPSHSRYIREACKRLSAHFREGEVVAYLPLDKAFQIGEAAFRVGQAALEAALVLRRISSITASAPPLSHQVEALLRRIHLTFRAKVSITSRTGYTHKVDYFVRQNSTNNLLFLLEADSSNEAKTIVAQTFFSIYDLKKGFTFGQEHEENGTDPASSLFLFTQEQIEPKVKFWSIVDDSDGVWKKRDYEALAEVSEVVRASHLNDLEKSLTSSRI